MQLGNLPLCACAGEHSQESCGPKQGGEGIGVGREIARVGGLGFDKGLISRWFFIRPM